MLESTSLIDRGIDSRNFLRTRTLEQFRAQTSKMSNSYIIEPQESSEKKDDTLIIVVNDDGVISVDQATLQNLIMNQTSANVSVVRLGQADTDNENGDITLTVDPPTFVHSTSSSINANASTDPSGLVDPFMDLEMDPEQLETLQTALQSEEAKQILGENVTAMLDMLSKEELQNTMRYNVQLDHCYTSRFSPSDPMPRDPLPVVDDLPESTDVQFIQTSSPRTTIMSSSINNTDNAGVKSKNIVKNINVSLQNKQINRPIRKMPVSTLATGPSRANTGIVGTPKLPAHQSMPRNITNVQQGATKLQAKNNKEEEEEDDEITESSTESSEPEPPSDNDNDSDFGPRSSRRSNARSRGGRKGLTTRGGSMTAIRRRGQKQLDIEQVRRLDREMAAAVNAMKTPEKDDKSERFNPTKSKRQVKTFGGKKKEELQFTEMSPSPSQESPPTYEKPLQTTNQVKANLISANMIKGDMVLTKPGQGRANQKVTFIPKHVSMKSNELKNIGLKKTVLVSKEKLVSQTGTKFFTTKDGKLLQIPMTSKSPVNPNVQISPTKTLVAQQVGLHQSVTQQQNVAQDSPIPQQPKTVLSVSNSPIKIKSGDVKREKRKSDGSIESLSKGEENSTKTAEIKTLDSAKKPKRDNRKAAGYVVDTLGPALFSTPDIIRRVGSNSDGKVTDNPATPTTPTTPFATVVPTSGSPTSSIPTTVSLNIGIIPDSNVVQNTSNPINKKTIFNTSEQSVLSESQLNVDGNNSVTTGSENEQKTETKTPLTEELQPSLDTGGIEGEDHLLATLEMEASKHEEDLFAEALLLQEELGVDLAEHAALSDPRQRVIPEPLASSSMLISPTIVSSEQDSKSAEVISTVQTPVSKETNKKPLKDDKEPIEIVRGNRVIKLPPIEAPATRSKRLQAKTETPQANPEPAKKVEKLAQVPVQQPVQHNKDEFKTGQVMNVEEEDDEDDEEDNSDSEDDPDRLWCICKRPHNNRFMICCDVCEDWFHGKCVHVSKAMGQQMEEKGIEWVCPNCLKKKAEEEKTKSNLQSLPGKQKTKVESGENLSQAIPKELPASIDHDGAAPTSSTMQCVVCKKEARNSSIYCSDACILTHAQETLTKDKPVPSGLNVKSTKLSVESMKTKPESRVIVFDKKTGKVLTGADAPVRSNLRTWLKENPSYEIVEANNINTLQIGGKLVTKIQTTGKTVKTTQLSSTKVQNMPKMIYTKVAGSKQTVLASNKKITIIPAMQQQTSSGNKSTQLKQTITTMSGKNPMVLKTPKSVTQVQLKTQAAGSPKQTSTKKQEAKPSPSQLKQTKLTPVKKPETEPIRVNIRKTLTELLSSRIKETEDLKLTDEEIADLAFNIELEMYKYFKDTGSKYKAKYRSLVFNIKDTKNLTLFRKIADRSLTPDAVVRLSPDEMASQELAEWREKETKHQLEMIKKNELDLMAQAKSIVVKTHKGEQIIENDGGIDHVDPKTPVQDIVSALNNGDSISSTVDDLEKDKSKDRLKAQIETKKSKNADERRKKDKEKGREHDGTKFKAKDRQERSRSRHRRSRDRDRSKTRDKSKERKSNRNKESRRDKDREREKDRDRNRDRDKASIKERDRQKEKDRHKRNDSHSRNRSGSRDSKDLDKRDEERKKEMEKKKEISPAPVEKPIEDRLWRHIEDEATTNTIDGNDSDISDREPSSTVTIKTPDINEESERDKEQVTDKETSAKGSWHTVWRGFVNMVDVAKFFITAQEVSGNAKDLMDDLPDTVDVVGRISHETVWDYISKMKRSGSKEILIIRLTAANDEEKIPYITLYSYLNSRSRLGVVGNVSKNIKDFYIMPFSNQSTIPSVLMPLTGPGFEENRPHLLLGIIVRNKKKRLSAVPPVIPSKTSKTSDRSYTPPLVSVPKEKTLSPSPTSSPMLYKATTLDSTKEKATTATATVTQMTLESLNKAHIGMSRGIIDTATICKIVPELSSKIDLTSSPGKVALDDDGDEPYSPGEMDDDMNNLETTVDSAANILSSSSKNSTELQRKMDELNRQIEEQKQQIEEQRQQIQSISSSFLDETTPTLPGLGLDPPADDSEEAYSPSNARSFTPPPPISKFAQPILDKVSDITIPPNLQEILANVKRQESSKVDPYLPSKPSASFLPTLYQNSERYSPSPSSRMSQSEKTPLEVSKENRSTLSTLSDLDLIRKAEEELAAVEAASALPTLPTSSISSSLPSSLLVLTPPAIGSASDAAISPSLQVLPSTEPVLEANKSYKPNSSDSFKKSFTPEQPKPPGLEDEDFPSFPSTPPAMDVSKVAGTSHSKVSPKSGIVLNVKRKLSDDGDSPSPSRIPRTKSRWGQRPSE
ncbi:death-inducer obliterator 1 isoform X2 [Solenopsis invicta]|nr:death-inducer obliterator 1 isoform X2 [Solenopsis invicta]XP_039308233.1 death-inducer obliterator 1 isoform X2 [Solenopsis invicta]